MYKITSMEKLACGKKKNKTKEKSLIKLTDIYDSLVVSKLGPLG